MVRSVRGSKVHKPRVITHRCVADQYAVVGQRIVEFSFQDGTGGLISLVQPRPHEDPPRLGRVDVYRTEGKVTVESDAPKRTYWAAYAGSALGSEIALHDSRRAALIDVVKSLGIDVLGRAEEEARDGEDEGEAENRVLESVDDETIVEWLDAYCSSRADDWHVNEVTAP